MKRQPPSDDSRNRDWHNDPSFWFRPGDLPERPRRLRHGIFGSGRLANETDLHDLLRPRRSNDSNESF